MRAHYPTSGTTPSKCLDLEIDDFAPAGQEIAANIRKALEDLKPLLTDEQIDRLRQQADIAEDHHSTPPRPRRTSTHPLAYLRDTAPIYTALSSHVINARIEEDSKPLLLRAHQAALLIYLGYKPTKGSGDKDTANFSHQLTAKGLGSILELATSNPATLSAEAIRSSTTILRSLTTSSTPNLAPRIPEFEIILEVLGLAVGAAPQKKPRAASSKPATSKILDKIGGAREAIPAHEDEKEGVLPRFCGHFKEAR